MTKIEEAFSHIRSYPAEPLPMFSDDQVDGFALSEDSAWWIWRNVVPEAVEAMTNGLYTFISTHDDRIFLLRDPIDKGYAWSGRAVEFNLDDYIFWSIREVAAEEKIQRKPVMTEMAGGICTECYFSNAPCTTHKI